MQVCSWRWDSQATKLKAYCSSFMAKPINPPLKPAQPDRNLLREAELFTSRLRLQAMHRMLRPSSLGSWEGRHPIARHWPCQPHTAGRSITFRCLSFFQAAWINSQPMQVAQVVRTLHAVGKNVTYQFQQNSAVSQDDSGSSGRSSSTVNQGFPLTRDRQNHSW